MPKPARKYVPAVGPRLRKLLVAVLGLFALLAVNAVYLSAITLLEWQSGETYQDYFYQYMFLAHLLLGLVIILPVIIYGAIHIKNAHARPNRRAVKAGYALFVTSLVLLASGLVLTRGIPLIEVRDPSLRDGAYWLHVATPFVVAWLFVLHRLAGPRMHWKAGGIVAAAALALTAIAMIFQTQDPRQWNVAGPASGEQYFFPSLSRTASGNFIPRRTLMMDGYCKDCHADAHASWTNSVHRLASFNNPVYLFSVRNTRKFAIARDGNVQAARFCAGCHDPVPFFTGSFDDPEFDDENHPTADAGVTCTACHAIVNVNSSRGNADYTIEEPQHYPFAFSDNDTLQWVNQALVKAKPDFHKKTFLKPLHQSPEFCGACHKVHIPEELNAYKWLRGQNHYDSHLLSGVSGHGVASFYYPPEAEPNCNGCHMALVASEDFGAADRDDSGVLKTHDHQFPSANTAIPQLVGLPESVNDAHRKMLEGALRVDIFGLKKDGRIDGELIAPLRPQSPALQQGRAYLIETVVRTLTLGHQFTNGTSDSNEIWLDVTVRADGRVIGRSGARDPVTGAVDPWSHFVNAYLLDRNGGRIERRNPEDIFTALYNNQIPPGAADTVHYRFAVPEDAVKIEIEAALHYRKFDTRLLRHMRGDDFVANDLPVTTIARDRVTLPVATTAITDGAPAPDIVLWQRWNDYGIGLLRKRGAGELRQAEAAFREVSRLGRGDGQLNLARVYLREGRLDEAVAALNGASSAAIPAAPWTVMYFSGLVDKQNGYFDEAIANFTGVFETRFADAQQRGFDFSRDYRLTNELASTLFEKSKRFRRDAQRDQREALLTEAATWFDKTLALDEENVTAHYGLAQIYAQLGDSGREAVHRSAHARYKPDDNARDRAISTARRADAAGNHAAAAVVIYDLQRTGNFGLEQDTRAAIDER